MPKASVVDSRDAKLHFLYSRVMEHGTHEDNLALNAEIAHRDATDKLFEGFAEYTGIDTTVASGVSDFDCLRDMKKGFEATQGARMSDY